MKNTAQNKLKIDLRSFRLRLLQRGLTIADFARKNRRSRATIYGAFKAPDQFGPTCQLIQEAFDA
jgi:hypothetical protein